MIEFGRYCARRPSSSGGRATRAPNPAAALCVTDRTVGGSGGPMVLGHQIPLMPSG
jgi:hypothetical protein